MAGKQQNNRSGGQRRGQQNENQAIALQAALADVLKRLRAREADITALLPPDIAWDEFYAMVNQALRTNPDLLSCTPTSIVNSCVKAAYDGIRLDGREGALVKHSVKKKDANNREYWEDEAQYFPMAFGLIQQIYRGGEVIKIHVDVARKNDHFRIFSGSEERIEHMPLLEGDRGPILAAYSIATLKSGAKMIHYTLKGELDEIRAAAKTKFVWDRWEGEMSKKSDIRRHRKTLPLGPRPFRDMEIEGEFTEVDNSRALPDHSNAPPRPTRQAAQLQHDQNSAGVDLGFGDEMDPYRMGREGVVVDGDHTSDVRKMQHASDNAGSQQDTALPADEGEWRFWALEVEKEIAACTSPDAVTAIAERERARLAAASKDRREWVQGIISDRAAELVAGANTEARGEGQEQKGQE